MQQSTGIKIKYLYYWIKNILIKLEVLIISVKKMLEVTTVHKSHWNKQKGKKETTQNLFLIYLLTIEIFISFKTPIFNNGEYEIWA